MRIARPSPLGNPSATGYCCRRCLQKNRITWYKNKTWHRICRGHWPQRAERRTADEQLYSDVMGKETLQGIRAEAEFQRRVDRILGWIFRKGE